MSVPTGSNVEAQARSYGTGGSTATPSSVPPPCPSGDVPKEGSRDIQQKGKIISVPHDWCKSTDSPVPYKIWAWQSSGSNLANTVRQTDCRSHVLGSIVNQCYGDEPGTGGGVKSGTNLAECTPLSASPTVRAEDKPMVRYLDKWWMNHKNTWGCLNNSEDMGKYNAPKVQNIDAKLSPIPSREEDQQALANGTQMAGATSAAVRGAAGAAAAAAAASPYAARSAGAVGQYLSDSLPSSTDTPFTYMMRPYVKVLNAIGAAQAKAHPDGKDQETDPQVTKGTGINNGVRVTAQGKRDYCPSPKHDPNKPWKNADPMDLDDVEAWRVLNGRYSIPLPGGARAAIHNGKFYIFQSDKTENECFHGYNVTGDNGLTKFDKSALQSLKNFFNEANNTTMSGVVSQIAKTIGMGKI